MREKISHSNYLQSKPGTSSTSSPNTSIRAALVQGFFPHNSFSRSNTNHKLFPDPIGKGQERLHPLKRPIVVSEMWDTAKNRGPSQQKYILQTAGKIRMEPGRLHPFLFQSNGSENRHNQDVEVRTFQQQVVGKVVLPSLRTIASHSN